jgi:hypothetical protein
VIEFLQKMHVLVYEKKRILFQNMIEMCLSSILVSHSHKNVYLSQNLFVDCVFHSCMHLESSSCFASLFMPFRT